MLRRLGLGLALLFLSAGVCAAGEWRPLFWSEDVSVALDHASIVVPADHTQSVTTAKVTYALRKPHLAEGRYLTSYMVTTERWSCALAKRTVDLVEFYDDGGRLLGSVAHKEPPVGVNNGSFAPHVFEAVCAYQVTDRTTWASAFDHWRSMSARMNADGRLAPIGAPRWAYVQPISVTVTQALVIDLTSIRQVGGLTLYRTASLHDPVKVSGRREYQLSVWLIDCKRRLGRHLALVSYGQAGVSGGASFPASKMTSHQGHAATPVVCDGRALDGPYFAALGGAYLHYAGAMAMIHAAPPPNPAVQFDYLCTVQFSKDDGASWGPVFRFRYNIDLDRSQYNAAATPQANAVRARPLWKVTPRTLHLMDFLVVDRRTGDLVGTYDGGKPLMKGRCQKGAYTPF